MSEFVVNGYAASLAQSLSVKRASEDNVEVITAEDVGKFPDTNLAESLSHLPGVSVDRLFGEGERVSIEGTDPNLNRVLLNGEPVSSADWYVLDNQSRQFNYLLLSPDVIGQAEVYKTWEPRLLEGSIGATVDRHHAQPPGHGPAGLHGQRSPTATTTARSKNEGSESAMFSWHNDAKTLRHHGRRRGQPRLPAPRRRRVPRRADQHATSASADPFPASPRGPGSRPRSSTPRSSCSCAITRAAISRIEFKPTDRLTLELTGLYVKQTMDNVNFSYYIYPGDNWSGLPNITNATVTNGVLSSYTINSAPLVIDAFNRAAQIVTQDYDAQAHVQGRQLRPDDERRLHPRDGRHAAPVLRRVFRVREREHQRGPELVLVRRRRGSPAPTRAPRTSTAAPTSTPPASRASTTATSPATPRSTTRSGSRSTSPFP